MGRENFSLPKKRMFQWLGAGLGRLEAKRFRGFRVRNIFGVSIFFCLDFILELILEPNFRNRTIVYFAIQECSVKMKAETLRKARSGL